MRLSLIIKEIMKCYGDQLISYSSWTLTQARFESVTYRSSTTFPFALTEVQETQVSTVQ